MPVFRYEAADRHSIPVHGSVDAANESELAEILAGRGLRLISASELTLDSLIIGQTLNIPRLQQLRVGESLREAFLTGLPAHEAVRAIAAEPISQPLLAVFPWAQGIATVLLLFSLIRWIMLGGLSAVNWVAGTGPSFPWMISVTTIVLIPSAWLLTWYVFSARPRSLLRHVAGRLESGQLQLSELSGIMPRQLSAVLNSKIPNEGKARTISELIPLLPAETMRNQQFAIHMLGPMVLAGTLFLGIYALLAFAVPDITSLFIDWGVDLPILTEIFVDLSDMFSSGGLTGWCLCFALFVTTTLAAFWLLSSGIISDWMESVPLVGVGFRWTMLSRVARLLAVMIRNDCPYPEALRAATGASHVRSVRTEGDMLARELESGGHILIPPRKLKGLPISMLFATDGTASETRRRTSIASTFQILAEMLDNATVNQGRLLALFLHFFIVMSAAVFVLLMMVGCFLPLIKMMNDIS